MLVNEDNAWLNLISAPEQAPVVTIGSSGVSVSSDAFLSSLSLDTPDTRCHPEAVKYVKNFKRHKQDLVKALFDLYNEHAFESQLPNDLVVTWNARLTKTAGLCFHRKMIITKPDPETGKLMYRVRTREYPGLLC